MPYEINFKQPTISHLNIGIVSSVWLHYPDGQIKAVGVIRHTTGSDPIYDHLFWFQRTDDMARQFGPNFPSIQAAQTVIRKQLLKPTKSQLKDEQARRTGNFTRAAY